MEKQHETQNVRQAYVRRDGSGGGVEGGGVMAKLQFKLGDSATMLIRSMDVHNEAVAMAERLGIAGQVETTVGRWDERGRVVGWTKRANTGLGGEILVEVFVSDLSGSDRERDRAAREMQKLIDENAALKARLERQEA